MATLERHRHAGVDGGDSSQLDTRDPEDIAAFERPAAGFDPDLFVAEIEPILDRRPARLARFEPFQPVGVRMGSFIVLPEAEMAGAGYNNLFRSSSNVRRDVAIDFRPSVRVVSNWNVHALEFRRLGWTRMRRADKVNEGVASVERVREAGRVQCVCDDGTILSGSRFADAGRTSARTEWPRPTSVASRPCPM